MVECLVSYQIIDFLESHSFISMDQSAYLKRHSTQTCLHGVIEYWILKELEMYGIIAQS